MASVYTADADTPEEATVDEGTQALETNNAVDDEVVPETTASVKEIPEDVATPPTSDAPGNVYQDV